MKVWMLLTLCVVLTSAKSKKQYQVFKLTKLNWHAAFVDCLSRELQLATINSAEEQIELENVMKEANVQKEWLWTSGTDQHQEGNFVWMSTGKSAAYAKWSGGQPDNAGGNENCLHVWPAVNGTIYWNDWQCSRELYYICEKKQPCIFELDVTLLD